MLASFAVLVLKISIPVSSVNIQDVVCVFYFVILFLRHVLMVVNKSMNRYLFKKGNLFVTIAEAHIDIHVISGTIYIGCD